VLSVELMGWHLKPRRPLNALALPVLLQVFRTYAGYVSGMGLDEDGLMRTYDDGAGNIDRDFDLIYNANIYGNSLKERVGAA
jgi:hypothetical protein